VRGQLPKPNRRRTNAPTIPTTRLPAGGRTAPAPKLPHKAKLGEHGKAWWRWAWQTPQAAGWPLGMEGAIARRASLEDDLAALEAVEGLDFLHILGKKEGEMQAAVKRVAALASGRLMLMREMRELDDRLGLTPKAMAMLRWTISDDGEAEEGGQPALAPVQGISDRWRRVG
jgi:hypothetical protein